MARNYYSYKNFHCYVKWSDWHKIEQRAALCNLKPTTFIKRMSLHGVIKLYDIGELNRLNVELGRIGNNVNQVAKLANETHSVTASDLANIRQYIYGIRDDVHEFLDKIEEKDL
jgi:hypothetical protein